MIACSRHNTQSPPLDVTPLLTLPEGRHCEMESLAWVIREEEGKERKKEGKEVVGVLREDVRGIRGGNTWLVW